MGSIADEMKKVLQMWDTEDQSQPEETKVANTNTNTTEQQSITDRLLAIIQNNPGITGVKLRDMIRTHNAGIPTGFTSSMLKQFTDRCYVTRTIAPEKVNNRSVYAYTFVPEGERKAMRAKQKENHAKAVARAAHARAMKEQKKAQKQALKETAQELQGGTFVPYEKQSISDLVEKFKANSAVVEQAKPAEWSPDDVLDNLTVKQARALHIALKEMFGGV